MTYPKVDYPTCLFGFMQGPIRVESLDSSEMFVNSKFQVFINQKPINWYGRTYAITHLQKKSHFGFLVMWPFCLHLWFFIQKQKICAHGGWVPNSEFGKYFRFGRWRWDVAGTNGKHWIPWSIYINFGFHWD